MLYEEAWLSLWVLSLYYSFTAAAGYREGGKLFGNEGTAGKRHMKRRELDTFCGHIPVRGSITKEKLSSYTHCEYLSIHNQGVTNIENGSFASLVNLDSMTIEWNNLKTINSGMWYGLHNLTSLNLRRNKIENLGPHTFLYMPEMTNLDLSLNVIHEIRADIWEENSKLLKLDLRGNQIRSLSPGVFRNLKKLHTLVLSENRLSDLVNGTFDGLHIAYLLLDGNRLTELRSDMWNGLASFYFVSLNVANNLIEKIEPRCFSRLRKLTILTLSNNPLGQISAEMFDKTSISTLYLSSTGLTRLDPGIFMGNLSSLHRLTLDGNDLEMTPDMFQGLGQLWFLNLESAGISDIRSEFWNGLDLLYDLKLSKNKVRFVGSGAFQSLATLATLDMEYNGVEVLATGAFSGLWDIYALNFKGNKISTINQDIFDPTDFPASGGHPDEIWLDLEGNPIKCDGNLDWMIGQDWLNSFPLKRAKCVDHPDMTLYVYLQCYTCT